MLRKVDFKAMEIIKEKQKKKENNRMNDWVRCVDRKLIYKGRILELYQDTVQIANGNVKKWDFIKHKGAAAIVPVLEDGRILMVKQYRHALDMDVYELPAGGRNSEEESFLDCATRELEEETGYKSNKELKLLITLYTTVAFCNERIDVFIADDLVKTEQNLDEDEKIDVEAYTLEELTDMVLAQKIVDSKTIAGLMAYRAYLDKN